jgi:hypothetical protein
MMKINMYSCGFEMDLKLETIKKLRGWKKKLEKGELNEYKNGQYEAYDKLLSNLSFKTNQIVQYQNSLIKAKEEGRVDEPLSQEAGLGKAREKLNKERDDLGLPPVPDERGRETIIYLSCLLSYFTRYYLDLSPLENDIMDLELKEGSSPFYEGYLNASIQTYASLCQDLGYDKGIGENWKKEIKKEATLWITLIQEQNKDRKLPEKIKV